MLADGWRTVGGRWQIGGAVVSADRTPLAGVNHKAAPTQTVRLPKTAKDPKLCNLPNNDDRDLAGGLACWQVGRLAGQAGFEE